MKNEDLRMSDYIVSARKYRPQTFDTVVGQEHITTTLKNAIRNQHLAHAYLFCGPRGVGKTTCARILAKTINCENPTPDMEACGVCNTCVSFSNNTTFNVFELDAASNNSVDDIRELVNQVRFAPQQGKYKIYIIDEVHMLSASAFNAFLKTLEEPPPYAIFILATTEKHKILPTILSRCQIFDFKRITTTDIVVHLQGIAVKESMVAQEAALHIIAQKSEGCMRDALSMLDRIASFTNGMLTYNGTMEHLNLLDADFYFGLTDNILSQDVAGTLLMLDRAMEKGFEGDVVINGTAEHFRNLLLCKDMRMAKLLDVPNDHKPVFYEKANQAPASFLLSSLNVLNQCELEYKTTNNKRLHVEMCLIRLCYVLHAVDGQTANLVADSADVKKNSSPIAATSVTVPNIAYQAPVAVVPPAPAPVMVSLPNHTPTSNNTSLSLGEGRGEPHTTPVYQQPAAAKVVSEPIPEPASQPVMVSSPNHAPALQTPLSPSAPALHTPLSPSAPRTSPPSSGGGKRLSMSLLDDMDDMLDKIETRTTPLTLDECNQLFEEYKQYLLSESKGTVHAQFMQMKLEFYPPDEIKIVSPVQLADMYAKESRSALLDYYRDKTKILVRITTELREDDAAKAEQRKNTVLSKQEMYEAMAMKNPYVARLKESLNMQIEY